MSEPGDPFAVPDPSAPPPPAYVPPPASPPPAYPNPAYPPPAYAPAGYPAPAGPRRWGMPRYDEPQPYHRILNTRSYRSWRPLVGLAVLVVSYLLLSTILTVALLIPAITTGSLDLTGASADPLELTAELFNNPLGLATVALSIAVFIPAAILALIAGHQLRPGWLHSVVGRMRWGYLVRCLGLGLVAVVVYLVISGIVTATTGSPEDQIQTGQPQLILALITLLLIPLQAAGEEYAFRGYALQALGSWFRHPAIPILVTSLFFTAIHLGDLASSVFFFSFGVVAAYLTVRTGGLEAAIGLHVVWNTAQLTLLALIGAPAASALERSETAWSLPLIALPVLLGYAAAALWLARRRGLDTRTAVSAPEPVWTPAPAGLAAPYPPR